MRIIVNLTNAERELAEDLATVAPRNRAARLRTLATVGLLAQQNGLDTSKNIKKSEPQPTEEIAPHDETDKRRELKTRLVGSLT